MKREIEDSKRAKEVFETRRKQLIEEKKLKQEELLRKHHEAKERKIKKKMLEDRWAMAKWLTNYIDQNHEK